MGEASVNPAMRCPSLALRVSEKAKKGHAPPATRRRGVVEFKPWCPFRGSHPTEGGDQSESDAADGGSTLRRFSVVSMRKFDWVV